MKDPKLIAEELSVVTGIFGDARAAFTAILTQDLSRSDTKRFCEQGVEILNKAGKQIDYVCQQLRDSN
jgi:hypothetical protein